MFIIVISQKEGRIVFEIIFYFWLLIVGVPGKKNKSEIKFQFPLYSSVSLNLAGFYWKNVCSEYWPL